jgi:hypothetical protein
MNAYLKEMGYTSINYTSKINTINKYIEMVNKINLPLFEKYIYYINLNKVKSKDLREQIKMIVNCHLDNDDIIIFYNKDNYAFYKSGISIPKNKIDEFLGISTGELYKCIICFRDDFTKINQCHQCSAMYCEECIVNSLDLPKTTLKKVPVNCMICKYTNGYLVFE